MKPLLRSIPLFLALLIIPLQARADCSKDTDCKGDRVCVNGLCQDPSSSAAPTYTPPPPPPPTYAPAPADAPPPPVYAPPPPVYMPPPPPPEEGLLIAHPHSWIALGGVGYLPAGTTTGNNSTLTLSLAGGSVEYLGYLPTFRAGLIAGGVTLSSGIDLVGVSGPGGLDFTNALWAGVGYDLGITRFLQFGPRIGIGYVLDAFSPTAGSSTANTLNFDGLLLIGAHFNVWIVRFFGVYFEVDGALRIVQNVWAPRIAGGIMFGW